MGQRTILKPRSLCPYTSVSSLVWIQVFLCTRLTILSGCEETHLQVQLQRYSLRLVSHHSFIQLLCVDTILCMGYTVVTKIYTFPLLMELMILWWERYMELSFQAWEERLKNHSRELPGLSLLEFADWEWISDWIFCVPIITMQQKPWNATRNSGSGLGSWRAGCNNGRKGRGECRMRKREKEKSITSTWNKPADPNSKIHEEI